MSTTSASATTPDLAYGPDAQSKIPANSTLVFVIDVLGVG